MTSGRWSGRKEPSPILEALAQAVHGRLSSLPLRVHVAVAIVMVECLAAFFTMPISWPPEKRCQRLGFTPTVPRRGGDEEWTRPLRPQTRDQRRKDKEKTYRLELRAEQRLTSPSCRNCQNWERDEKLSDAKGTFGSCWVSGGVTKANTWCDDHNPR